MLPLIHYLPKPLRRGIASRFMAWELFVRPTKEQRAAYLHHFLNELNLLEARELQALFPDSKIVTERLCGLVKSLIAVR